MYIEDASRVTAGPRSLAIVEELWRSAYIGSVMIAELPEKLPSTFGRQPKSLQNGTQNRLQDAFQRAWKRKWRKCDFEQHYNVLARFLVFRGLGDQRKIKKDRAKIASKFSDPLGIIFSWILGGFWKLSWRQNRIKIGLKSNWKFWLKKDRQNETR